MFNAPLMRDERRLITDTQKVFKENPQTSSFLYCNWGAAENEGRNQSFAAMKVLLTKDAPLPFALSEYFTGRPKVDVTPNRTGHVSGGPGVQKPR